MEGLVKKTDPTGRDARDGPFVDEKETPGLIYEKEDTSGRVGRDGRGGDPMLPQRWTMVSRRVCHTTYRVFLVH